LVEETQATEVILGALHHDVCEARQGAGIVQGSSSLYLFESVMLLDLDSSPSMHKLSIFLIIYNWIFVFVYSHSVT